jgi:hypothetical protein
MVFRLLLLLSIVLSTSAFAVKAKVQAKNPADCDPKDEPQALAGDVMGAVSKMKGCPNFEKLNGLCNAVNSQTPDSSEGNPYEYYYQRKIYEASCAEAGKDSPEIIAQKIQAMWKEFESKLTCNTPTFNVPNGSILKFAVDMNSFDFLDTAIRKWKVNLNKVDASDSRTLLDYITFMKEKYKGTDTEAVLDLYYKKLVKAGAKHKAEL